MNWQDPALILLTNQPGVFDHKDRIMESPGKFLKREREARNISLREISKFTKINECYLKAIEEDRYDMLPGVFYVKAFLNVYARYLTLNPKDIVLQYENYLKNLIPPETVQLQ